LRIVQEISSDPAKKQQYLSCNAVQTDPSLKSIIENISSSNVSTSAATAALNQLSSNALNQATAIVKNRFYSSLIDKIFNAANSSVFSVFTEPTDIQNWNSWAQGIGTKPPLVTTKPAGAGGTGTPPPPTPTTTPPPPTTGGADLQQLANNTLEAYTQQVKQIQFTTIGHIIDAAFAVIEENITQNSSIVLLTTAGLLNELNRIKIMLSNLSNEFRVFNIGGGSNSLNQANMAYIPVDMFFLKAFLIEKLVKQQRDSYPLFLFLKDVVSSLIINALNIKNIYKEDTTKFTNASLASAILYFNGDLGDFKSGNNKIEASKLTQNTLDNYYLKYSNRNKDKFVGHFLIYDKYMKDFVPPQGNANSIRRQNEQNGIYHFTFGQDYGLVKSINFSRIDISYTKEAKATGTKTFYLGQFRDIYNADITMVGNNFYTPGMLLYIKPSIETSIVTSGVAPNFSQITGIGGYYQVLEVESSISEDGYETKLKTIWQTDGFEFNSETTDQDECSRALANAGFGPTAGGIQIDLSELDKATKNSQIQAIEAQIAEVQKQISDISRSPAGATSSETRIRGLTERLTKLNEELNNLKQL
jgi:hypothetical protein